jgi:cyclohexyl-isocyanide hydratase
MRECRRGPRDRHQVLDQLAARQRLRGPRGAGIDIALTIAEQVAGRELAESIQLGLEYDPSPPFRAGHPNVARPELVAETRTRLSRRYEQRREQLVRLTSG